MSTTLHTRETRGGIVIDINILALDQATTTGYAIFNYNDGKAELLEYGKESFEGNTYIEKISQIRA